MSQLDDILGTTKIARRYPAEYGNKKTQLQKQLIKDLMLELIKECEDADSPLADGILFRMKVDNL